MEKKKSYNPFKMWGSYVGAILFIIIENWFYGFSCGASWYGILSIINNCLFLPIVFGFLIGWGIHSLVRKARK